MLEGATEMVGGNGGVLVQAETSGVESEELAELVGPGIFAVRTATVVKRVAAEGTEAIEDFFFAVGEVRLEPMREEVLDAGGEAEGIVSGEMGAGGLGGFENPGQFVIGQGGDDRGNEYADGDTGGSEFADGVQAVGGGAGAGFHDLRETRIESGHRDKNVDALECVKLRENINVAGDEVVLGGDVHRVAEIEQHFEASTSELEFAFDGLVAVGDAGATENLRLPFGRGEGFAEEFGSVVLDENFRFEIKAGGETEVFVRGTCEAVNTAVLAAAVGVDGGGERSEVGFVGGDDVSGAVGKKLSERMWLGGAWIVIEVVDRMRRLRVGVGGVMKTLKAIWQILICAVVCHRTLDFLPPSLDEHGDLVSAYFKPTILAGLFHWTFDAYSNVTSIFLPPPPLIPCSLERT